jgi:hypothetical protein
VKTILTAVLMMLAATTGADPRVFSPRIWIVDDVKEANANWHAFVKQHRSWFDRAVKLAPRSAEAARARAVLGVKQ